VALSRQAPANSAWRRSCRCPRKRAAGPPRPTNEIRMQAPHQPPIQSPNSRSGTRQTSRPLSRCAAQRADREPPPDQPTIYLVRRPVTGHLRPDQPRVSRLIFDALPTRLRSLSPQLSGPVLWGCLVPVQARSWYRFGSWLCSDLNHLLGGVPEGDLLAASPGSRPTPRRRGGERLHVARKTKYDPADNQRPAGTSTTKMAGSLWGGASRPV
jgi:hypothetical protein